MQARLDYEGGDLGLQPFGDGQVQRLSNIAIEETPMGYRAIFPGLAEPAHYRVASVEALRVPALENPAAVDCAAGAAAIYTQTDELIRFAPVDTLYLPLDANGAPLMQVQAP